MNARRLLIAGALVMQSVIAHAQWINLRSPHDVISGRLDLYPQVDNRLDAQADTPLWAHVQFWSNELLAKTIAEACVDNPPGWPPARPIPGYEIASDDGVATQVRAV